MSGGDTQTPGLGRDEIQALLLVVNRGLMSGSKLDRLLGLELNCGIPLADYPGLLTQEWSSGCCS